jgi:hypothetical protein
VNDVDVGPRPLPVERQRHLVDDARGPRVRDQELPSAPVLGVPIQLRVAVRSTPRDRDRRIPVVEREERIVAELHLTYLSAERLIECHSQVVVGHGDHRAFP